MEKIRKIDEQIKKKAELEEWNAPESCMTHVEQILESLPEIEEENMRTFSKKKMVILAAALAAVVGTTAMASELFSWNEKAVENFGNPTKEEQNTMTMDGIAKEQTMSVTDAGITLTAVQTVQDKNSLYILLDVTADENIIDGNGGFENPDVDGVYAPELLTKNADAFGNISMAFSSDTPSFELSNHGYYEISALKSLHEKWEEDSITIQFKEYSYYTYENGDTVPHHIEGDWALTLPLSEQSAVKTKVYELNREVDIAEVPVMVKRVELSPLSLIMVYDIDDIIMLQEKNYGGEEDVYINEVTVTGFLDKDGHELRCGFGAMSGAYDYDNKEVTRVVGLNKFVDTDQVSAILFGDNGVMLSLE